MARGQQAFHRRAVTRRPLKLIDDITVPIEIEPGQPIDNGGDRRIGRALAVGILDPQQHFATRVTGKKPIEERRPGAANMQKSRGRGCETGDDRV